GYVEVGESFEDTVRREVMEEVGLKVKNIRYYKSQPWPFTNTLLAGYFCEVDGSSEVTVDQNELSTAVWLARDEIPEISTVSLTGTMIMAFKRNDIV
ncbi:MAG: NUDIX domain-containing protein, partial [Clostridiales bacterium]|nr:NUDIX domain-containing protein [Clostridiales bacterium]